MTQHGSFPGRPRGRRERRDNDVPDDVPDWAGYDAAPRDQPESPGLSSVRGQSGPGTAAGTTSATSAKSGQRGPGEDWAGSTNPDPMEAFSERWRRRGSESREERRADRRKRRRQLIIGGGAAAVVIAVAVYFLIGNGGGSPAGVGLNSLITQFLPGEIQQVPNACSAVPSATISQYLPGQLKVAEPPLNSGLNTQCTWTLDKKPLYGVLEVNIEAYTPSGLASGDGSATFAAIDAYAEDEQAKQHPGRGEPKATVTDLSGMPGGNQTVAFQATQVFNVNNAVTDVATVVVRYRNVIVTVVLNGLDHSNMGIHSPVSPAELSSAASTVANQVTGSLVH